MCVCSCVCVVLTWSLAVVVEVLQIERARVDGEHAAAHAVLQRRQRAQLQPEVAHLRLRPGHACNKVHINNRCLDMTRRTDDTLQLTAAILV